MNPNKCNHQDDQIQIINSWIEKSVNLYKSNCKDEIVIFSTLYSAINSVSWLYSAHSRDSKMIMDLAAFISAQLHQDLRREELRRIDQLCTDIINFTKDKFTEMHKLQKRTNASPLGETVQFKFEENDQRTLSRIRVEETTSPQRIKLSIGILYQFRCNLVHGCKGIHFEENICLAKKLILLMVEIFQLLPVEIISTIKQRELHEINFEVNTI